MGNFITGYFDILKDVNGSDYFGLKYENVLNYLEILKDELGDRYETFTNNQKSRDGDKYHTTLVSVPEIKNVDKEILNSFIEDNINKPFEMLVHGIGKAYDEKKDNTTYFVVLENEELNSVRLSLGLKEKDLHITIGFDKKDVFTKPKDKTSLI